MGFYSLSGTDFINCNLRRVLLEIFRISEPESSVSVKVPSEGLFFTGFLLTYIPAVKSAANYSVSDFIG